MSYTLCALCNSLLCKKKKTMLKKSLFQKWPKTNTHTHFNWVIYFKTPSVQECHLVKMAVGNKSSSSLVLPLTFFSLHDSFLISCMWSCMCTWHLLADVTPPCPSARIMHIPLESKLSIRMYNNHIICAFQGLRESSWDVYCCNWFLFSCSN